MRKTAHIIRRMYINTEYLILVKDIRGVDRLDLTVLQVRTDPEMPRSAQKYILKIYSIITAHVFVE